HDREYIDICNEWIQFLGSSRLVYRYGDRDGVPVGASMYLGNSPRLSVTILQCEIAIDKFQPFDSAFYFYNSAIMIEMQHSVHLSDVDEERVRAKLLPAHCVPAAGN